LKYKLPSQLYLGFHCRDFSETSYLAISIHALKRCKFGCVGKIKGTLLGEASTSSATSRFRFEGFSCTFINSYILRMRYKRCEFVCFRYIIKGANLENKASFWLKICLYLKDFHETSHFGHPCLRYKRCNLDCYRSVIKGTLLQDKVPFSLYFRFCRRNFPETSYFALSALAVQAM